MLFKGQPYMTFWKRENYEDKRLVVVGKGVRE